MPNLHSLDYLTAALGRGRAVRAAGRIQSLGRNLAEVSGLAGAVRLGHRVDFPAAPGRARGEVVGITRGNVLVVVEAEADALKAGDPVGHLGPQRIHPDDSWLGRVVDPDGEPLDGRALLQGTRPAPLDAAPPPATARRRLGARLATPYAAFDTLLPLVHGQRIGLFAGSGVGKSSLVGAFASDLEADVVVIALVGERGREVGDFVHRVLGPRGMARSVVVAATSDRSALTRRRAAFSAMAVAEHFRDQGKHVLVVIDSVTRLAEAQREIAVSAGESTSMRGYPPSLVPLLAGLAERAGPGAGEQGDITAVMTVLVAGSDMEEPVADTLRGLLDGHVVLSRRIAERGRFPAVDLLQSVSRALPDAASGPENALIAEARRLLGLYEESELMIRSGLYQPGASAELDRAVAAFPAIDRFLAAPAGETIAESFEALRRAVAETAEDCPSA